MLPTPIQPAAALSSLGRWLVSGLAQGVVVDLRPAGEHRLAPRGPSLLPVSAVIYSTFLKKVRA